MEFEKKIEDLQKKCFSYLMYLSDNDYNIADDISSFAIYKYYIKQDTINNPESYVLRVCYNEFLNHKKSQNKHIEINQLNNIMQKNEDNNLDNLFKKITKFLTNAELSLLLEYYSFNKSEIAERLNIKETTLRKKISALKKKAIAAYKIDSGYTTGKDIIAPKLYYNIIDFIDTLKLNLKHNSINKLAKYLRDIPQNQIELLMDFSSINKYEFVRTDTKQFKIILLGFNKEKVLIGISIYFTTNSKTLRVSEVCKEYKQGIKITNSNGKATAKNILSLNKRNHKGETEVSNKDLLSIKNNS